jgi:SAM-dependent methyltransferase
MRFESRTIAPVDTPRREVQYLSPPAEVSMADRWFEISSTDHFWIRRRFEVLQRIAEDSITSAREMAEIGCGHGLLQRQIEDRYGRQVVGFDLNDYALKQNISRRSPVFCYDILRADPTLQSSFDVIFLFDVLEHISDADVFLEAVLFHLAPNGKLILNVPAGQWLYSRYDLAAGHICRYSYGNLCATAVRNRLRIQTWTYWGLPLFPALVLRKVWLLGKRDQGETISSGFDPRSMAINRLLGRTAQFERIPQKLLGTSLMAALERIET